MVESTVAEKCLAGGIGCGIAGLATNPMDVVKIRNQQYGGVKYGHFVGTLRTILAEEGVAGLFKGAAASVLREGTYSSFRMGMYEPIRLLIHRTTGAQESHPGAKWASAFASGGIGSALFNPIDLLKVRFQSHLPGTPKPFPSIASGFKTIYSERGIAGLWAGGGATVVRAALLTSGQLGSYDVFKNNVLVAQFHLDKDATGKSLRSFGLRDLSLSSCDVFHWLA